MVRGNETKKKVLHRMKIARGHFDKVIDMVEKDKYCIDVIHQSLAVQAALGKIDRVILDNHMRTRVSDAISKGKKDEVIEEVMRVMKKL